MSSHRSPSEIRAGLKHPIIDADGHWVEYTPVFADKMRKAAGDKAADGFLASQRRSPHPPRPATSEPQKPRLALREPSGRPPTQTPHPPPPPMPPPPSNP